MSWHEQIDGYLSKITGGISQNLDSLTLAEPLREALTGVKAQETTDPIAGQVLRAMADQAIDPMVTDVANRGYPYAENLSVLRGWRDHSPPAYNVSHSLLDLASRYLIDTDERRMQEIGIAFGSAAYLLSTAYPVDYPPFTGSPRCEMVVAVGMFTVVSQVHANVCGEEKNQAAVAELAEAITAIAEKE